jgi:hypothetical protein
MLIEFARNYAELGDVHNWRTLNANHDAPFDTAVR